MILKYLLPLFKNKLIGVFVRGQQKQHGRAVVAHWTHNPKVAGSSPACASYSNQGGEAIGSKQWVRITKMIACFLFDVLNRENR